MTFPFVTVIVRILACILVYNYTGRTSSLPEERRNFGRIWCRGIWRSTKVSKPPSSISSFLKTLIFLITQTPRRFSSNVRRISPFHILAADFRLRFTSACSVAGAILGMAQVWYIGPLAARLAPLGGDICFELAAGIAALLYPPMRYLEIQIFGR